MTERKSQKVQFLRGKASNRKLRLTAVASLPSLLPCVDPAYSLAIAVAERYADSLADEEEREAAFQAVCAMSLRTKISTPDGKEVSALETAVGFAAGWLAGDLDTHIGLQERRERFRPNPSTYREILGNPFRTVIADPIWLTSTVLSLAHQMYDARDFSAMPILL